jgi:hypothetical protein
MVVERAAGTAIAIDPAAPNWIATDERGLQILRQLDGRTPLGQVVRSYAAEAGVDMARAWLHVDTFARDALRQGFVSTDGAVPMPYLGRAEYLRTDRLREFWIQVNDFCNLACAHCLVSSGPALGHGLPSPVLQDDGLVGMHERRRISCHEHGIVNRQDRIPGEAAENGVAVDGDLFDPAALRCESCRREEEDCVNAKVRHGELVPGRYRTLHPWWGAGAPASKFERTAAEMCFRSQIGVIGIRAV